MGDENNALGVSKYNYTDITVWRFIHYYQQLSIINALKPKSILEIGPGDHTVSGYLKRKGIKVVTADNDIALKPDIYLNLLEPEFHLKVTEYFDVCLAAEVLEHLSFKHFPHVLKALGKLSKYIVISVPYTTIRLFPDRPDYGKIMSCEGRVMTHIPKYVYDIGTAIPFFIARIILKGRSLKRAKSSLPISLKEYPDSFTDHHWDCGEWATRPSVIRKTLAKDFIIHDEKIFVNTNCIFWTLSKKA